LRILRTQGSNQSRSTVKTVRFRAVICSMSSDRHDFRGDREASSAACPHTLDVLRSMSDHRIRASRSISGRAELAGLARNWLDAPPDPRPHVDKPVRRVRRSIRYRVRRPSPRFGVVRSRSRADGSAGNHSQPRFELLSGVGHNLVCAFAGPLPCALWLPHAVRKSGASQRGCDGSYTQPRIHLCRRLGYLVNRPLGSFPVTGLPAAVCPNSESDGRAHRPGEPQQLIPWCAVMTVVDLRTHTSPPCRKYPCAQVATSPRISPPSIR